MTARRCVLLVVALTIVATSCGDGGPNLPIQNESWLVQFKRVTLASETPDRLEIEIEVRTGSNFSEPARDGTKVSIETSVSTFEGNGPRIEAATTGGHALVTLVLPNGATHIVVTALVENAETQLAIVVDESGSMRLLS